MMRALLSLNKLSHIVDRNSSKNKTSGFWKILEHAAYLSNLENFREGVRSQIQKSEKQLRVKEQELARKE